VDQDQDEADDYQYETLNTIYMTREQNGSEIKVNVNVDQENVQFTVDTAASVSVIGENTYQKYFKDKSLQKSSVKLRSYGGQEIPVIGQMMVDVDYEGQRAQLPLIVAKGPKVSLLGRNWMKYIRLNWSEIFSVMSNLTLPGVLSRHDVVFHGSGSIKKFKAKIRVKPNTQPVFKKARSVPYALNDKVGNELDRLENLGIVRKVRSSVWAAPVVVVPKADLAVRICGDYKVTINPALEEQPYPLPTAEDIFATLAGGKYFTVLDLSQAYSQLELDEESRKYLTINTHKGLYEYTRLAYGVSTAPHIFQSVMDQILQGLEGVCCYIDDVLIKAKTKAEALERLDQVLARLEEYGIKVKKSKCKFIQESVEYLGHRIDAEGIHPTDEKIKAITEAKKPTDKPELKSLLGLINYYAKFFSGLSTKLAPLNRMLRDDVEFEWSRECQEALEVVQTELTSDRVLVHYDPSKPLVLATDASPIGVGAVLSHTINGVERPVAFGSRTLSDTERNWAQIEKEGQAIVYGVQKFHKYLYGRRFKLITDHKPLTYIFAPKKEVPTLAALRLQRWSLILMAYQYDIEYRRSGDHGNADYLSRAPSKLDEKLGTEEKVNYFSHVGELPITAEEIQDETRKDPILSRVYHYVMNGWPNHSAPELEPYFSRRGEMSCDAGCLLWGMRVVIPPKYQAQILEELHWEHLGMVRSKALARSYFWFPGIDQCIEELIRSCDVCLTLKNDPPPSPLYPWKYPEKPWSRVHFDFFEFRTKMYLLGICSYSKWLEVVPMKSTTSERTVDETRKLCSQHGIPDQIVTDNGPQFIAEEYDTFCKSNGIKHTLTPPYHPESNGQAERSVQIAKNALKKHFLEQKPGVSESKRLASFLLTYRTTPHTVTGRTPAELFVKRQLKTRFSLLRPDVRKTVQEKQEKQKEYHDSRSVQFREFEKGERVRVKNCRGNKVVKFVPGKVVQRLGPLRYLVQVGDRVRYTHADHLRKTGEVGDENYEQVSKQVEPSADVQVTKPITRMQVQAQPRMNPFRYPEPGPAAVITPSVSKPTPASPAKASSVKTPIRNGAAPPVHVDTPHVTPRKSTNTGTNTPKLSVNTGNERRYPVRVRQPPEKMKDYVSK